jgi:hypothetical protein
MGANILGPENRHGLDDYHGEKMTGDAPREMRVGPPPLRTAGVVASLVVFVIGLFAYGSLGGALDVPNEGTWSRAFFSLTISIGGLATALWLGLPSQYRSYGPGFLLLLAILMSLLGGTPAGGIAALLVQGVFGITALVIARQQGFTRRRIGYGVLWVIYGSGLVVFVMLPLALGSVFVLGMAQSGRFEWLLVPIFVLLVAAVGAGGVAGLWMQEGKAIESRSRAPWATAGGGYAAGAAVSFLTLTMAGEDNAPGFFVLWFLALAGFSLAAATLAGYSLRAGNLLVVPTPEARRDQSVTR